MGIDERVFTDWVRHGLSGLTAGAPARVTLNLSAGAPVERQVSTYVPGDITGLDPRAVVRTSPRDRTHDFEPNLFAMVELADRALPWLASPPPLAGRTLPWIVLVVVEDRPGVLVSPSSLAIAAPASAADELPDLEQSWAWAHAHGGIARLVAARRLIAGRSYHACIVPAFAAGVAAALGAPAGDSGPAWTRATQAITLPVLFSWQFSTGPGGDFASLVRLLAPQPLGETVGHQRVDLSDPGWAMPAAAGATLDVSCVLRSPAWRPPVPSTAAQNLGNAIGAAVDAAATPAAPPAAPPLAPPFYGSHATRAVTTAGAPSWQRTLTRSVAARIAAGVGAALVRADQDELVDAAWRAAGDTEVINRVMRLGQLAGELARRLGDRHVGALSDAEVVALARPMYARLRATPALTLRAQVRASAMPAATLGTNLRRLTRTGGMLSRAVTVKSGELVARVNAGAIAPVPVKRLNQAAASFDAVASGPRLAEATPVALTTATARWFPAHGPMVIVATPATHAASPAAPLAPLVPLAPPGPLPTTPPPHRIGLPPLISAILDRGRADAFATAARVHQAYVVKHLETIPDHRPPPLGDVGAVRPLAAIRATIQATWSPRAGIAPQLVSRITGIAGLTLDAVASFQPFRPTPVLERPLLHALQEHAPDYVIAGGSKLDRNRVAIAAADQDVVRALLVGANDELSRELLWRGYPAAFGHTWLRTFWGRVAQGAPTPDIPPIESWPDAGPPADAAQLVLLVRGDVLHRYPSAVIYAVEAAWRGTQRVVGSGAPLVPVIATQLGPDLAVFGFTLAIDAARGTSAPPGSPGWYFVIGEHPAEPRFGLAAGPTGQATRWRDVGWDAVAAADLAGNYLRVDGPLAARHPSGDPGLHWGAGSAQLAAITVRHATRVAMHASTLMP